MVRCFLIAGCQRSGTTMLAASLARHPDITIFDESESYARLSEDSDRTVGIVTAWAGYKVPRWTDLLPGPFDGEPGQPSGLRYRYREEPILQIVRAPADVVWSMHQLKMGDSTWLDRYGIPLLKWRVERDSDLRKTLGPALALEGPALRWASAAGYWYAKNRSLLQRLDDGWPLAAILYSDIVREPRAVLAGALASFGIEWSNAALASVAALDGAVGGTDPARVIDGKSMGGGANLDPLASSIVAELALPLYESIRARIQRAD